NNGNETSKTTTGFTGSAANTYTYDQANRLTSWNNGTTTTSYGYDASGNRTQVGANVYTYDARDELTSDGTNTYRYTARGTLAAQRPQPPSRHRHRPGRVNQPRPARQHPRPHQPGRATRLPIRLDPHRPRPGQHGRPLVQPRRRAVPQQGHHLPQPGTELRRR